MKPLGNTGAPSRNGHFFIAVDVAAFYGEDEYQERYNELVEALKASGEAVRLPGERPSKNVVGVGTDAECEIVLSDAQYAELMALKDELEGSQCSATGNMSRGSVEDVLKTALKTGGELHEQGL